MVDYNRFQTFGDGGSSYGNAANDRVAANLSQAQALLDESDQTTTYVGGYNFGFN